MTGRRTGSAGTSAAATAAAGKARPGRISWPLAVGVAGRVAGAYPLEGTYHQDILARQAPDLVAEAGRLVEEETGLSSPDVPEVRVVGRQEWVEANVRTFSRLLMPAEERLAERSGVAGAVAGRMVAVELGALLGILARRVLGQYELVLPTEAGVEDGDAVYLVGPNVLWLERLHQFRPAEFRMWLALHECTHRMQFVGVPWVRDHFLELVRDLVSSSLPEPGRLARVAVELREAVAAGEPLIGETGLLGLFASPRQRDLLDRVQALMSLLEGHGHVLMDRIGSRILVTQERMSSVLRRRRQDLRSSLLFRLTGMEMKFRQYEEGERFVLEVERVAGPEALGAVWERPEALPTLDEIRHPGRWLARVA